MAHQFSIFANRADRDVIVANLQRKIEKKKERKKKRLLEWLVGDAGKS